MIKFLFYWGVWLVIPIIVEGFLAFLYFFRTLYFVVTNRKKEKPNNHRPLVTVLVPCYNSHSVIEACLNSLLQQTYQGLIEVIIINNGSNDGSREIFNAITLSNNRSNIKLHWQDAPSGGKAKALNIGIYQAKGEILVTMDSDTTMEIDAIEKLVDKYNQTFDEDVSAVGGSVLIDYTQIKKEFSLLKLVQIAEMYEYLEAFLVGRVATSIKNQVYTLAGAFSSFRVNKLLQTRLYHQKSIAEDTFLTFEIKKLGKVIFEPRAIVYTEPIESIGKLTLQRFRWQRGQMEIAFRYKEIHQGWLYNIITHYVTRTIFIDHTLMFSRTVWLFLMFLLYIWGYPMKVFIGANVIMYVLYIFIDLIYLIPILMLINNKNYKKYIIKTTPIILFMPLYRFFMYLVRIHGIIDGIMKKPQWKAKTLKEELFEIYRQIKNKIIFNIRWWLG